MNDQQLLAALRGLDRPVRPDPEFADALFAEVSRRARVGSRPFARRELLLVAALLAAAVLGVALSVGTGLLDGPRIVTAPSPAPSSAPVIEPSVAPATLRPPASSEPIEPGELIATPVPQSPDAPFGIPPWETELQLIGPGGRTISPTLLQIPSSETAPHVGQLVPRGNLLWAVVTPSYVDGPAILMRVDTATNTVTTVPMPDSAQFGTLDGSEIPNELWLSSDRGIQLDATTGEALGSLPLPEDGGIVGADADGVWVRIVDGIVLLDRETGAELRRIDTREGEGHAYRGIWRPPAFGSLWDLDRNTGYVYRLDPTTGEEVARIFLGELEPGGCGFAPSPLTGPDGPDGVLVGCPSGTIVIDPTTNTVARVLPSAVRVVADGAWWSVRFAVDARPGWDAPANLVRIDPTTGRDLATWSLNLPRTGARAVPVVSGDSLWLVVGERPSTNHSFDWNLVLVRVPIAELNG